MRKNCVPKAVVKESAAKAALARLNKRIDDSKISKKDKKIYKETVPEVSYKDEDKSSGNLNPLQYECPFCHMTGSLIKIQKDVKDCIKIQSEKNPEIFISAFMSWNSPENRIEALPIVKKYLENIIKNPNDQKYKKIKKTNKIFIQKIYPLEYCDELWKCFGFVDYSEVSSDGVLEPYYIFPETSDFHSLEIALMIFDTWVYVSPIFCRNVKKFNAKDITKKDQSEDESFYEFTAQDIKDEMERLRINRIEYDKLKFRANAGSSNNYTHARVRIKFPNNILLDFSVLPHESSMTLYEVVGEHLIDKNVEFELFTSGIKRTKISFDRSKISELDLLPRCLLIFMPKVDGEMTKDNYLKF